MDAPDTLKSPPASGQPKIDIVAPLHQPQPRRRGDIGLNLVGGSALLFAILQRSHATGVQSHVDVRGIRIEALTKHEHRLLVRVPACVSESDVGGQGNVVRNFLPDKVERVGRRTTCCLRCR